mmetsp:Transcript_69735/g.168684  ORF Transcript_69735/g.168684 Transcript_69735/m.168684 type:complete len:342 (-) Transcript_69735:326-1351(-)
MLAEARLEDVELDQRGSVLHGRVNVLDGRRRVAAAVMVLRDEHAHPQERRRHLPLLGAGQAGRLQEALQPLGEERPHHLALPRARRERLQVGVERRDALTHHGQHVGREHLFEVLGRPGEVERQATADGRAGELFLQRGIHRAECLLGARLELLALPLLHHPAGPERGRLPPGVVADVLRVAGDQLGEHLRRLVELLELEQQLPPRLLHPRLVDDLRLDRVEVLERPGCVAALLDEHVLEEKHLAVLVIVLGRALERRLVRLDDADGLAVPLLQVRRQRKGEPVVAVGRLEREQLLTGLHKARQVAHLHLQQRQVAKDLDVVLVVPQRTSVALDRLQVLAI